MTHDNHACNWFLKISFDDSNLVRYFKRFKVSRESFSSGGTKLAGHSAPNLRGNANAQTLSIRRGNADSFNERTIMKAKDVFPGPVDRYLFISDLGTIQGIVLRKELSECFWKVCHLVIGERMVLVKPLEQLFVTKFRLARLGSNPVQFLERICFD